MIKTLRRKFIAIAMLSLCIVLTILIGSINIMNYASIEKDANATMRILKDNDGTFPDPEDAPGSRTDTASFDTDAGSSSESDSSGQSSSSADSSDTVPAAPSAEDPGDEARSRTDAERPFSTRYFSVLLDSDGNVTRTDLDHIAAVSETEAKKMATALYKNNRSSGYLQDYKYVKKSMDSDGTLYIFLDCTSARSSFREFLIASILVSILGAAAVFVLVLLLSRRAVKPVAESYAKQKRFITDASHEIKTPLSIIRADTEVLEMTDGDNKWITSIRHQVDRLTRLTERLVFLSRMDEENNPILQKAEFDLTAAATETLEGYQAVCQTAGRTYAFTVDPGLWMYGDEAMIRQIISLLMDNAVKYSDEGGRISFHVSGSRRGKAQKLTFTEENTIPEGTIAAGSHPEFFDRFYRSDPSRNSRSGSFGIGLSVVSAIVEAHGGKVSASCPDGKHMVFLIVL